MRILVVEDDNAIAAGLCAGLRESGHAVDRLSDGVLADRALQQGEHDLLVLDLSLPGIDGACILQQARRRNGDLAVIVVTARDSVAERVRILDLGADDYLVKPFAFAEFAARIRALIRRRLADGAAELTIGDLRLNVAAKRAWVKQTTLELTAREFGLLSALAVRQQRLTSRAQLIEALCEWDQELTDNGLDIAMHRLRQKLRDTGAAVRTVRGLGYILEKQPAKAQTH